MAAPFQPCIERIAHDVPGVTIDQRAAPHVVGFHQQPAHMRPEEASQRAMRILVFVCVLVVPPVHCDPVRRRILQRANREERKAVFEPARACEAAMREQSVIADVDAEDAEHVGARHKNHLASPTEEPWQECKRGQQVNDCKGVDVSLFPLHGARRRNMSGAGARRKTSGCGLWRERASVIWIGNKTPYVWRGRRRFWLVTRFQLLKAVLKQ
jgi:hypothetical protein